MHTVFPPPKMFATGLVPVLPVAREPISDEQVALQIKFLRRRQLRRADVTREWDVPLMVTRGYPSVSFLYSAAETIQSEYRPTYLYYFGDHDPSGRDIDRFVEQELRRHAPDCELHFERVAVTPEQIEEFGLQTRPTKKTDSRSKSFEGESVEVDAIDPDTLREICRECIVQHIDEVQLNRTLAVEDAERGTLATVIASMEGAA